MKTYSGGVRHDYQAVCAAAQSADWRQWGLFALGLALPLAAVTILLIGQDSQSNVPQPEQATADALLDSDLSSQKHLPATVTSAPITQAGIVEIEPSLLPPSNSVAAQTDLAAAPHNDNPTMLSLVVSKGDTLEQLFRRNGLRMADLAAMTGLPEANQYLRMVRPGDSLSITHQNGNVLSLQREINAIDVISISRQDNGFAAAMLARPVERPVVGAHGDIRSSLFEAGMAAGVSDALIMEMAGIFQWDIDFIKDVRQGDQFTLLYEELWRDGRKVGTGNIIAAEFLNRGKAYRASRFTDSTGKSDYYTPEGLSVRKAFVRAPVAFTRISGNFNPNRKHPILNTIRAHRGVDYAAPTGTPIRAAGDGKIIQRGSNGGFGNSVVIQHGGNITTLYAHMSRFAKQRIGNRVSQGEIIGYVGKTGLATGPHLHYEYRVNGVHRDPRTVALPPAEPVANEERERFSRESEAWWSQLGHYQRALVAASAQ